MIPLPAAVSGVSRLDGEHHGHAPRTRPGQPKQEVPQHRRDIQVQQHRDDVKAGRGESPQSMLQPEQCGQHWPVRGLIAVNGAGLKPNLPRARQALGRLGSHQQGVVPHEAPLRRWIVADRHQQAAYQHGGNVQGDTRACGGKRSLWRRPAGRVDVSGRHLTIHGTMDAGRAAEFRVVCSAERSTDTAHATKETMVRGRWQGKAEHSRKC